MIQHRSHGAQQLGPLRVKSQVYGAHESSEVGGSTKGLMSESQPMRGVIRLHFGSARLIQQQHNALAWPLLSGLPPKGDGPTDQKY